MAEKAIRKLGDLDTLEVSLVSKGANKKRFAVVKADRSKLKEPRALPEQPKGAKECNMDPIIEAVLKADVDGEDKIDAALTGAGYSDKAQKAFKALFKIAAGFKDELPETGLSQLAQMCGYPVGSKELARKADDLSKLDPETRAKVEALYKANESAKAEMEAVKKQLATERDERRTKEFIAKAATDYKALPGIKSEDLGLVLKAITDAAPDQVAKVEAVLKAAATAVGEGELLKSAGAPHNGMSGDAMAQINKLAEGLVLKSADQKLTQAQAVDFVMTHTEEGRRLYQQYLGEHPAQTGRR